MGGSLVCPYEKCRKEFVQPLLLTSGDALFRESYYACPHCFSKLDLMLKDAKNFSAVEVVAAADDDDARVHVCKEEKPEGCPHFVGYLKTLPEDLSIPEGCLTCPKIMLCFVRH